MRVQQRAVRLKNTFRGEYFRNSAPLATVVYLLSGRPRAAIFHSRLSRLQVGTGVNQPRSSRIRAELKIVFLSLRQWGPDRWMSRRVMLGLVQNLMSHSKSIVVGSSRAALVVGCGRLCSSRSKIVIAAIRRSVRCDRLRFVLGCRAGALPRLLQRRPDLVLGL